ncbi:MAG: helix-turn-helix transcriptional regulator [Clostridia bacterium]|nr:helix-turn-helix transcriptional regulator [Clostridia bacterium]
MNKDFPRIIRLLRKERGISQKQAAIDLDISPSLLSHYEKGIRECPLDFVLKVADYYDVSCDYLLGRTLDKDGYRLAVEGIPENDPANKENAFKGNVLTTLNKKLISNSLNIIFDILRKYAEKDLTDKVSYFFMLSIYNIFRTVYAGNKKNPQSFFSISHFKYKSLANAKQILVDNDIDGIVCEVQKKNAKKSAPINAPSLSPEIITQEYPLFSSSLFSVIQRVESSISEK